MNYWRPTHIHEYFMMHYGITYGPLEHLFINIQVRLKKLLMSSLNPPSDALALQLTEPFKVNTDTVQIDDGLLQY